MLRVLLFALSAYAVAAKLNIIFPTPKNGERSDITKKLDKEIAEFAALPLWVLSLDSAALKAGRLTRATDVEEDDFDSVVVPMIRMRPFLSKLSIPEQAGPKTIQTKSKSPKKYYPTSKTNVNKHVSKMDEHNINIANKNAKPVPAINRDYHAETNEDTMYTEINKIINKFAMYANNETSSHLIQLNDPSLPQAAVYFKGPYASLIMRFYEKQWHYVISPPSPFPEWFYEEHNDVRLDGATAYVEIPQKVKAEFLEAIIEKMNKLFYFPA